MNRLPVALFGRRNAAEPVCARFREKGIPAEIHDELRLEKLWFVPKGSAGARLEVPAEEFERAEQMLHDWDATEGGVEGAIRCPECHSLRVDYPQFTRKSLMTNLALGLASSVGMVEKEFYCEDCHFTWPKEGTAPRRDRPHMAPYYFIEGVVVGQGRESKEEHRKAA